MKNGFTLIELLVVISIISFLSSITLASLNTARNRARYTQIVESMDSIEKAAHLDYGDNGVYANDVIQGEPTSFVPKYLSEWPTPSCTDWTYDWENWYNGDLIRISLRNSYGLVVYYYCIDSNNSELQNNYGVEGCSNNGEGTDIKTLENKAITCSEGWW